MLTPTTWKHLRYYLVECTPDYSHCGGTADRLAPIPFHLAICNQTERLLLIKWTKPTQLEEFLLPPQGGMDWRVPDWLWTLLKQNKGMVGAMEAKIVGYSNRPRVKLVRVKYQTPDHGALYYNNQRRPGDPTFDQVYHDTWRVCFTPTSPIAQQIEQQMQTFGILPGQFVATHVRALYQVVDREEGILSYWAQNAIRCATAFPAMPILFVSDSSRVIRIAKSYANQNGIFVVARPHPKEPLHLEKADNWTTRDASEFYDTFVDLYMLGMSSCVAYNMGGYGKWGSQIGYNSSCAFHMKANMIPCDLHKAGRRTKRHTDKPMLPTPLFLPPMDNLQYEIQILDAIEEADQNSIRVMDNAHEYASQYLVPLYAPTPDGTNLWDKSQKIPQWMKNYFEWHIEQRKRLTPEEFKSVHVLVMSCLKTDDKCGGTSDRLKSLPTILRIAAATKRLLLIQWSKPAKLEEFLVPPKGGIDWRVPDWLAPYFATHGLWAVPGEDVRELAWRKNESIVISKYQSNNGGSGYYNEQLSANETPFDDLYHDCWLIFFTPSLPLATIIRDEMRSLGLAPGKYVSTHLRALYAVPYRTLAMVKRWTVNGIK
jgi:hypothetical protein